jgi:hypothetical protein
MSVKKQLSQECENCVSVNPQIISIGGGCVRNVGKERVNVDLQMMTNSKVDVHCQKSSNSKVDVHCQKLTDTKVDVHCQMLTDTKVDVHH